jgi:hypothetical protein
MASAGMLQLKAGTAVPERSCALRSEPVYNLYTFIFFGTSDCRRFSAKRLETNGQDCHKPQ